MEVRIEIIEMFHGKEFRETRIMPLENILNATFPQNMFYNELMKTIERVRREQENIHE